MKHVLFLAAWLTIPLSAVAQSNRPFDDTYWRENGLSVDDRGVFHALVEQIGNHRTEPALNGAQRARQRHESLRRQRSRQVTVHGVAVF